MNIRDIIAGALLDGQNQIHDLRSERATPSEITDRMFKSVDYWEKKALGVEPVEPTPTEERCPSDHMTRNGMCVISNESIFCICNCSFCHSKAPKRCEVCLTIPCYFAASLKAQELNAHETKEMEELSLEAIKNPTSAQMCEVIGAIGDKLNELIKAFNTLTKGK